MIVVNGIEFRTLDNTIEIDGNTVYEAWCNGSLVYPELGGVEYVEFPYDIYELITFEETFHVSNSVLTNRAVEFDCNQIGCAAVNSSTKKNPKGESGQSFRYGEHAKLPLIKAEPCRYYDSKLNAMAYMSKWTVYDSGDQNPGISLVRFYALDNRVITYKGTTTPIPCPFNFVSSKYGTEGQNSYMTGKLFRESTSTTYIWNVPDDPPFDAATSFGVKEYYRNWYYTWEIISNDPWLEKWIKDNGIDWTNGPAEIPEREIGL